MTSIIEIGNRHARRIAVTAAGLNRKNPFGAGRKGTYKAIAHLGYVQLDSISVIARAHHHQLYTRIPNYRYAHLTKLQQDRKVLEYWHHAAAYLPMTDFRYTLPLKQFFYDQKDRWPKADEKLMQLIIDRVRKEGPLMARDFKESRSSRATGWWDWKPAKWALERLFFRGELTCLGRKGFQKMYDLTERVIPSGVDTTFPSPSEEADHLIFTGIRRYGLVTRSEITYLQQAIPSLLDARLADLAEAGQIVKIRVKGLAHEYFSTHEQIEARTRVPKSIHILSPFDPLIIQRKRVQDLFRWNYVLECYVPAKNRKRGYLALPILVGCDFVGTVDLKVDRRRSVLQIQYLHLDLPPTQTLIDSLWHALQEFSRFQSCSRIELVRSNYTIQFSAQKFL